LRQEITGQLYERTARTERLAVTTSAFLLPVEPERAFRDVYDFDMPDTDTEAGPDRRIGFRQPEEGPAGEPGGGAASVTNPR
jgi:hypothetical protein